MNYESFDVTRGREHERALQRIATRGIVQLFNTVRKQQQHSSSSSASKKEKKESSINKGEFLDMLKTIDSDEVSGKAMKKNQPTVRRWLVHISRQRVFFFIDERANDETRPMECSSRRPHGERQRRRRRWWRRQWGLIVLLVRCRIDNKSINVNLLQWMHFLPPSAIAHEISKG
jgi:hypothetical protein